MLEVMHIPVVSTAHMPGPQALDEFRDSNTVAAYINPYGGILWVGQEDPEDLPEWLRPVREWARARGYEWIRFDADAEEQRDLPKFEEAWA